MATIDDVHTLLLSVESKADTFHIDTGLTLADHTAKLEQLQLDLDAVTLKLADLDTLAAEHLSLDGKVDAISNAVAQLASEHVGINNILTDPAGLLHVDIINQINSVLTSLDETETAIIDDANTKDGIVNSKLDTISSADVTVNTKLDDLDTKSSQIITDLTSVKTTNEGISSSLVTHDTDIKAQISAHDISAAANAVTHRDSIISDITDVETLLNSLSVSEITEIQNENLAVLNGIKTELITLESNIEASIADIDSKTSSLQSITNVVDGMGETVIADAATNLQSIITEIGNKYQLLDAVLTLVKTSADNNGVNINLTKDAVAVANDRILESAANVLFVKDGLVNVIGIPGDLELYFQEIFAIINQTTSELVSWDTELRNLDVNIATSIEEVNAVMAASSVTNTDVANRISEMQSIFDNIVQVIDVIHANTVIHSNDNYDKAKLMGEAGDSFANILLAVKELTAKPPAIERKIV